MSHLITPPQKARHYRRGTKANAKTEEERKEAKHFVATVVSGMLAGYLKEPEMYGCIQQMKYCFIRKLQLNS